MEISQVLANSIVTASTYAILAIGFNLLLGTVKFFNVAYGGCILAGGYGFFLFYRLLNLPMFISLILALAVGAIFSWLSYKFIFAPLRKKKAKTFVLLIASFGLLIVMQAVVAIFFSSSYQPLAKNLESNVYQIFGARINTIQIISFFTAILLTFITTASLKWSRFGKAVRAIQDDEEVAELVGINTKKIIGILFMFAGIFATIGVILFGLDGGIRPGMGVASILPVVAVAIIGGMGSIWGGVLGALAFGLFENIAVWQLSGDWREVITFTLLILVLIFRPRGIFGKKDI